MTTALMQPWAERLAWTLLHFLWEGALIAALFALARFAGGRKLTARTRYAMACAALLAMALAPVATYLRLDRPIPRVAQVGIAGETARPSPASLAGVSPDSWQAALPWIVMAWFVGVAGCSIRLAGGWISATRLRSSGNRPAPAEWRRTLDQLMVRMRVSRPVQLLISDRLESPSVIGWLRPVILAPFSVLTGLAPEHVEALLAHELAHISRHDYLVNLLQSMAESLLFYHPAVWWLSHQVRAEREHCCDDLAVTACGDLLTYATALARLESARPAHFKPALAASDGSLVRRIRRLVDPASHAPSAWGAAWLLSVLMLLSIGGVAIHAAQDTPAIQMPAVSRDAIWPDTVKQGDIMIEVRGLGRLTSATSAEVRIAETQVKEVMVNQSVTIDFRKKPLVSGIVTQVGSTAVNGTVPVEVQIKDPIPDGVAIGANLDSVIAIRRLSNVVHVGRPVYGKSNSEATLFKIEPDGKTAIPVKVQFGSASVNVIEVKSGLQPGDKVILSDMSGYEKLERIGIR